MRRIGMVQSEVPTGWKYMSSKLTVEMVAVGHGDCFVLKWEPEAGTASHVVVDGGPRGGGQKLNAALNSLGASCVDLMVLSHTDADHVDGLLEYARIPGRAHVKKYWGPCLPAFKRHSWLFASAIRRGLDAAGELEVELAKEAAVSWPVENAVWRSEDGGLRIRVLSPAGRLIERLLIGDDATSLFLQQPMPVGWLFDPAPDPGPEDRYEAIRASIRSGEIDPDRVPDVPVTAHPMADREQLAAEAERDFGVDPEFFGNGVLNDTSLVLLVEADFGGAVKRMLFTGDLQTFTYLVANHPMGLGCEIVKAPHHGSRSHLGDKDEAYDEVWQWLRPRAVLVSAGGKHGLPRSDFRNATLRSGATLFCACRRGKEILIGPHLDTSCNKQFSCSKGDRSVRLEVLADAFTSTAQACGSSTAGMQPLISMVQHVVEPSAILDRMSTAERDKHVTWVTRLLRDRHCGRVKTGGSLGLEAIGLDDLVREARSANRFRAAADMDIIVDAAARDGWIWRSKSALPRDSAKAVWIMPTDAQFGEMERWLADHLMIALAVHGRRVGNTPREMLLASDTGYLRSQIAKRFGFPEAMFDDALWPQLSGHLVKKGWQFSIQEFANSEMNGLMCTPTDLRSTFDNLSKDLPPLPAAVLLREITQYRFKKNINFPEDLVGMITPYCKSGHPFGPIEHDKALTEEGKDHVRIFEQSEFMNEEGKATITYYGNYAWSSKAPTMIGALFLSGY